MKASWRAFRRQRDTGDTTDIEEYHRLRNYKGKVIGKALQKGFRTWVRSTAEQGPRGMWCLSKWARNRDQVSGGVIPPLRAPDSEVVAETDAEKVDLLRQAFFPKPPEADLADLDRTSYQRPDIEFPAITEHEVFDAIKRAPPDKAPGEDGIPNRVWKVLDALSNEFVAISWPVSSTRVCEWGAPPGAFNNQSPLPCARVAPVITGCLRPTGSWR